MLSRSIFRYSVGLISFSLVGIACTEMPPPAAEESKIDNAMSAAPAMIADNATIMDLDGTVLRQGSNGWTCMPSNPEVPANDPACFDAQWMEFMDALMNRREPNYTGMGLSYMLQGGGAASLTDPLATQPAEGEEWKQ